MHRRQRKVLGRLAWLASTSGLLLMATLAQASVLYSGGSYVQNFDSLPNAPENVNLQTQASPMMWQDDTTATSSIISIPGWYLYHPTFQNEGGTNGRQRMRIGAGTANTGAFMSYGSSGSGERALGDLGSNTLNATVGGDVYIGLRLTNNTGGTLTEFTLRYDGEQWRDGGATAPVAQTMTLGWSTTATAINDPSSAFTDVPTLAFTSPVFANTGSGAAVDGNNAGKVAIGPVTVTGLTWAAGTDLWLRWNDINNAGNDHGLSIDNLTFSAIPEPSTIGLLVIGSMFLAGRRRLA